MHDVIEFDDMMKVVKRVLSSSAATNSRTVGPNAASCYASSLPRRIVMRPPNYSQTVHDLVHNNVREQSIADPDRY